MPKPAKIDPAALRAFLADGHSQVEAARHFNVSEAAISFRVKKLQIATSKVIALERAGAVVDQNLSAADRLAHIQRVILTQLGWAEDQAYQPGVNRAGLSEILIKLSAEVRAQIRLQHDITRALIDLQVVREFQRTVFEAISEESPATARRIVDRLKQQRALRQSVELPTLDGLSLGEFDVARSAR